MSEECNDCGKVDWKPSPPNNPHVRTFRKSNIVIEMEAVKPSLLIKKKEKEDPKPTEQ
jgi:hypothetical protein